MSWYEIGKSALLLVTSNAVVVGVFSWIANKISERSLQKLKGLQDDKLEEEKAAHNRELETLKSAQTKEVEGLKASLSDISYKLRINLDRGSIAFKTHFDLEFKSYVELWTMIDDAIIYAARIPNFLEKNFTKIESKQEMKNRALEMYDEVRVNSDKIRKLKPFIDIQIADEAIQIAGRCLKECGQFHHYFINDLFSEDYWNQDAARRETIPEVQGIINSIDMLAISINSRVKSMYLVDV